MESGWKSKRLINPKEGKKGDKVEHETHRTNRKRVWTKTTTVRQRVVRADENSNKHKAERIQEACK